MTFKFSLIPLIKYLKIIAKPIRLVKATILSLGLIYVYSNHDEVILHYLHKKTKVIICKRKLKSFFTFKDEVCIFDQDQKFKICEFYPSNIDDLQKVVEISDKFEFPLVTCNESYYQINNKYYFKLNFSKFNNFIITEDQIQIQPGVSVNNLIKKLLEKNMYIEGLNENYGDLTFFDLLNNPYYLDLSSEFISKLNENFIEAEIVLPSNELLKLSRTSNVFNSTFDLSKSFMVNSMIYGMMYNLTIKLCKGSKSSNNLEFYSSNGIKTLKIIKEGQYNQFACELNQIVKTNESIIKVNESEKVIILDFKSKDLDINFFKTCNSIVNSIYEMASIYNFRVLSNNYFPFDEELVKYNLGWKQYDIQVNLKELFDPKCLFNPHMSIIKKPFLKRISEKNKMVNYLLQKQKLL